MSDLHEGGAVMWIGGAAIMFTVIMVTFFQWTRESRPSAGMGWLEAARRSSLAERIAEAGPAVTADPPARGSATRASVRFADVDADDDQLAAYNAYLARINQGAGGSETAD